MHRMRTRTFSSRRLAPHGGRTNANPRKDDATVEQEKDGRGELRIVDTQPSSCVNTEQSNTVDIRTARRKVLPLAASTGASLELTVRAWGEAWLTRREREGMVVARDDRSTWRTHVETARWIDWPMGEVASDDAREWWTELHEKTGSNPTHKGTRKKPLSANTLANIRQTVRGCFESAVEQRKIATNPFAGLGINRSRRATTEEEVCFLGPSEQDTALALIEGASRWLVQFALFTGVRQQEQWSLRLSDVHLETAGPNVFIRYGKVSLNRPGESANCTIIEPSSTSSGAGASGALAYAYPTKGGRPRRVYLNGRAVEALEEWLRLLPAFARDNPYGLVFPHADGSPRGSGRVCRSFERIATAMARRFTWHGLRHTCATSLLAGWWGEKWNVRQVQRHLGHSSIEVTERYLHVLDSDLSEVAARTIGGRHARCDGEDQVRSMRGRDPANGEALRGDRSTSREGLDPELLRRVRSGASGGRTVVCASRPAGVQELRGALAVSSDSEGRGSALMNNEKTHANQNDREREEASGGTGDRPRDAASTLPRDSNPARGPEEAGISAVRLWCGNCGSLVGTVYPGRYGQAVCDACVQGPVCVRCQDRPRVYVGSSSAHEFCRDCAQWAKKRLDSEPQDELRSDDRHLSSAVEQRFRNPHATGSTLAAEVSGRRWYGTDCLWCGGRPVVHSEHDRGWCDHCVPWSGHYEWCHDDKPCEAQREFLARKTSGHSPDTLPPRGSEEGGNSSPPGPEPLGSILERVIAEAADRRESERAVRDEREACLDIVRAVRETAGGPAHAELCELVEHHIRARGKR